MGVEGAARGYVRGRFSFGVVLGIIGAEIGSGAFRVESYLRQGGRRHCGAVSGALASSDSATSAYGARRGDYVEKNGHMTVKGSSDAS